MSDIPSSSHTHAAESTENVVDQEHASKVIKNFINSDTGVERSAVGAPATQGKNFCDRRDIIKALTILQASYKPDYVAGQTVNINTDDFIRIKQFSCYDCHLCRACCHIKNLFRIIFK